MKLVAKTFDALTTKELYEILKARVKVFVVEQKCPYQEVDDLDEVSLHIFYEEDQKVIAYLRAFYKEEGVIQMGRVLTLVRGTGLGGRLLNVGLATIKEKMPCKEIYIEAQSYATGFYEREGFRITSEEFLEDGIPHVQMVLKMKS
jgi:ElaA protein